MIVYDVIDIGVYIYIYYYVYVLQHSSQLSNIAEAHQLISTVVHSGEVFNNRPCDNPTVCELVEYMLQSEILGMSKLGSNSGKMMSLYNN